MKLLTILLLCAVAVGCGYGSKSAMQTPPSVPNITSFNPANATHGDPAFALQVMGANFATGATVSFGGANMQTTVNSGTMVTAQIPQAAIANAGMVPVIVTNPATNGIYGHPAVPSAAVNFTVN